MACKIGFIGAGNMAQALFRRLLAQRFVAPESLYISDIHRDLTAKLAAELGVQVSRDNPTLAQEVDVVVLAVKPISCAGALRDIRETLGEKPLLSIVLGWTPEMLRAELTPEAHVLRVMPNTPAMVGEGMTLFGATHTLSEAEFAHAHALFASAGDVVVLEDRLFDAATCISGCGPAFLYQIIEALGDAGVMYGLPRALAYRLASQTLVGAGKMALESGLHPGELKDAVCSPGGTTIVGVYELEKSGVRAAMIDVISATYAKTKQDFSH
ncbi:MAG: pyrroline-5-carboxylate reductase [Clostridia bacterium]|nr:pyrroline-5-carboxylate reductase [Clostridia bacterium]